MLRRRSTWLPTILLTALAVAGLVPSTFSRGAEGTGKTAERKPSEGKGLRAKPKLRFTPEREAAALAFVHQHHADLERVLEVLKSMRPEEYESAIGDIFTTSESLAKLRDQDEARYKISLEAWKVRSRIELTAARLSRLEKDPKLEAELRSLLERDVELQIAQQRLERERQKARLDRLDEQIARSESQRKQNVEKRFRRYVQNKQPSLAKSRRDEKAKRKSKTEERANASKDSASPEKAKKTEGSRTEQRKD